MSLTTYAELKTAVSDWTDDGAEASDFVDTYIDLAESLFNREIRAREMETSASVSIDANGEGELPSDFLEIRRVSSETNPAIAMEYLTPEVMRAYYATTASGYPKFFTVEGSKIRIRPTSSAVTLRYYQTIPALSDSQTTNWLLTRNPNLYLQACLAEHYDRTGADAKMNKALQRRQALIESLNNEDKAARWPNASARVKGVTP